MDMKFKEQFLGSWRKYFGTADLPICFYYTNENGRGELVKPPTVQHQCIIGVLSKVRSGKSLSFEADSIGCGGGKRYLGFSQQMRPNFEYFLSCGIPGEMEGERYKRTPEMVREIMKNMPVFKAPARYIVFKRFDALEEADQPDVAIFYAKPDVLAGLFTLSSFDEVDPNGVFAPFSAGCGSIVLHPYLEKDAEKPRCVIGMFDVSARPYVQKDDLTFAMPMSKFRRMVENMDESFLITSSWEKVRKRIEISKQ
ncbi:MAG: hypothetical protein CVU64_08675 [Deltaproteobacteria bacterium HGW-Deltaproteobacteria-21]|nr:MAG: hypothetical protein CVU64_08675 [Deltaproteobacteria bacterium HGW-Deltaproteobacteria-21]